MKKIDVLVFGPHPDDAEIGAGGLLLKMKALGYTTGIVDMTRGEMGWGTPEERGAECDEACAILKLDVRENLDMGDHRIEDTFENRCAVAAVIRKHRPDLVFAPHFAIPPGRGLGHNDHYKTGILVAQGHNLAHLRKAPLQGEPHQAKALFWYFLPPGVRPTFVVDVSPYFDEWMRALRCHKSQFFNPDRPKPKQEIQGVVDRIENIARANAWMIGGRYAQSFYSDAPLKVPDPLELVREIEPRP